MTTIQSDLIFDLLEAECEFGNQTFTWNGVAYPCCPSGKHTNVAPDVGTLNIDDSMTMTVRLLDQYGNNVFPSNIIPKGQDFITFNGDRWSIISVDKDSFSASIRIWAQDDSRGLHG